MAKKLYTINLDEDLVEELDRLSNTLGMSRSMFVNTLLRGNVMGETKDVVTLLANGLLQKAEPKEEAETAIA